MAEIVFEAFAAGLESTRGTLIDPPTHFFSWPGTIEPAQDYARPDEARGTLVGTYQEVPVRQYCNWSAEGILRPRYAPFWLNMITGPGVITTPTDGVATRIHTHKPAITSDTIKTASFWWGDPNVQQWSAPYGYMTDWEISSDASGTDVATMSVSGSARYWAKDTATVPAHVQGSMLVPARAQVWLDTSSAIGTTLLSNRAISASISGSTGVTRKWYMAGSALNFSKIGRGRPTVSATITVEVPDATELDLMDLNTIVKLRCRMNGDLIESVGAGPTLYYNYVQFDIYGQLKFGGWSDLEGSNRVATFTVDAVYDSTLGASYQFIVQNSSATV